MTPNEKQEFEEMKRELETFKRLFQVSGNRVILAKTLIVDGVINADRIYTQRSGNYVELTT